MSRKYFWPFLLFYSLKRSLFVRRQSVNIVDQSESRSHLKLCYASYDAAVSCVDHVTVAPPTPPPLEQLLKIQMCHTFEVGMW